MKKIRTAFLLIVTSFFVSTCIFAQHGSIINRRVGVVDNNQIKTVFMNQGVVSQPGIEGPQMGWIFSQNGYAGDMSLILGLELPIRDYRKGSLPPDGIPDTIHSVVISPVDRPGGGEGENGISYTFEPLPGYFNPMLNEIGRGVALSTDTESWPVWWPDHPEYGTGVWNGLYGPDNFVGNEEALFVMDDYNDQENQLENDFYPDTTNTIITGHGIEVKVRYVELDNPAYKDILFKIYDIKNTSQHNYHKLVLGNLTGTYVGNGSPEWNDDVALYYPKDNLIVVSDFDNYIDPLANPNWQGQVGMFGESFIYTPTTNIIASFDCFVPASNITMSDDENMWSRITPGHFIWPSSVNYIDSIPYAIRGEDGDYIWGSQYFSINSGETKKFATAVAYGYSKNEILLKMKYAEALYNSDFDTAAVTNSIVMTSQNYHKIVSGDETITWNNINSEGTVEIWYSFDGGNDWEIVTKNSPNNGSFDWNSTLNADGAFSKLLIFAKDTTGFVYAIDESEYFTVNNSGNGSPFIKILNEELQPGIIITSEEYDFNLLIGDPENDPILIKVLYNINLDTVFHVSQNINVTSDTIVQIIPVALDLIPNSDRLRIKFEVTDGVSSYFDITPKFSKQTPRQILPPQNFSWIRHYAEVPVEIRVIDTTQFIGREYLITFSDTIPNAIKTFSVFNTTTSQYTLLNEPLYPHTESIVFDGMTIYTEDILTDLDEIRSGWNSPHPKNLNFAIDQFVSQTLKGYRYPFDYKFIFSDTYNDSSNHLTEIFGNGAPPINTNLNFKIYRSVEGIWDRTQFAFVEPRPFRKNILSFDDIAVLSDPTGTEFSWRVIFHGDSSSNIPVAGDTLYIYTMKGLSVYDSLIVNLVAVDIDDEYEIPLEYYLYQNYPNPFNPETKIKYSIAASGKVILKIYDILGREVSTLVNEEKALGSYEVKYDARDLSSGIYFFRLTSGSFVETKKMVLLK